MIFGFLAELFFPRACVRCMAPLRAGMLCEPCRAGIAIARVLTPSRDPLYRQGAAARYDNPAVKALVHTLKFRGLRPSGDVLASLLTEYAAGLPIDLGLFAVIPIPLSKQRFRARGFNQSELIARPFAARFGLALDAAALARVRHTKPQSETKSAAERKENVRGCFAVRRPEAIRGRRIVLIDDVTTSGATFREAALALKAAGALEVLALAAAEA